MHAYTQTHANAYMDVCVYVFCIHKHMYKHVICMHARTFVCMQKCAYNIDNVFMMLLTQANTTPK